MARKAREFSQTGMYHIIFRGISRQNIFEEKHDFTKMTEILKITKDDMEYEIYAYCFMNNHVHLFLKENEIGQISKIMSKILSRYALWFNKKYQRVGVLFENRYKSEPVENERYYLGLIRYIHQNPVKAGMVEKIEDYEWSSYQTYIDNDDGIVDVDFCLKMLSNNSDEAIRQFIEFNNVIENEQFSISNSNRKNAEQIKRIIMSEIGGSHPSTIRDMKKEERNRIIIKLIKDKGINKSLLERATGISRGTIIRIMKNV